MVLLNQVLTGDKTDVTKYIVIGVICIVLVIGVTVMGVISSRREDEELSDEENTNNIETEEK